MFPSPFAHNFADPNKINRIKVTVEGPAASGKSNLANFILAGLRAQQFQAGITDPKPDTAGVGPRYHQNTIVAIEVLESGSPSLREVELQGRVDEWSTKSRAQAEKIQELEAALSMLAKAQGAPEPEPAAKVVQAGTLDPSVVNKTAGG